MDIYNKLSPEYDKLYKRNIENFQDKLKPVWNGDDWFVDFYPTLGMRSNEVCDLLFYGQAVNGWGSGFDLCKEITDDKINESIFFSNNYFSKLSHSPLDWVNVRWSDVTFNLACEDNDAKQFYSDGGDYRTYRSFFWNVTFKLTNALYGLNGDSWDWSKKIVWSNLYKIAEHRANPSVFLREQQLPASAELIRQEIEELKPKYCIVSTNYEWWKPYKSQLGTKDLFFDKSLENIQSFEQYGDTKLIITSRPRFGDGESHVSQILKLMKE